MRILEKLQKDMEEANREVHEVFDSLRLIVKNKDNYSEEAEYLKDYHKGVDQLEEKSTRCVEIFIKSRVLCDELLLPLEDQLLIEMIKKAYPA